MVPAPTNMLQVEMRGGVINLLAPTARKYAASLWVGLGEEQLHICVQLCKNSCAESTRPARSQHSYRQSQVLAPRSKNEWQPRTSVKSEPKTAKGGYTKASTVPMEK